MKRRCLVVASASAVILRASTAQAQKTGRRFGFVIADPASVAVQWPAAGLRSGAGAVVLV